MNIDKLESLLQQKEGPTLDFKREWYRLDHPNPEAKERQRGELIKDILSLANGNANVAGETAYLVIGASDKFSEDGIRDLHDVEESPTASQILQIVNAACEPAIEDIWCESIELEGKRLLVIIIPPSPHLHETTRDLKTSAGASYTKHAVFVRHGEQIDVASAKERDAIRAIKRIRFAETRSAPSILTGVGVGTAVGVMVAGVETRELDPGQAAGRRIGGGIVGGFMGGLFGNAVKDVRLMISDWPYLSTQKRIFLVSLLAACVVAPALVVKLLKHKED